MSSSSSLLSDCCGDDDDNDGEAGEWRRRGGVVARSFSNVNSKGGDISEGVAAIWMGRRPWRGGGTEDRWLLDRV